MQDRLEIQPDASLTHQIFILSARTSAAAKLKQSYSFPENYLLNCVHKRISEINFLLFGLVFTSRAWLMFTWSLLTVKKKKSSTCSLDRKSHGKKELSCLIYWKFPISRNTLIHLWIGQLFVACQCYTGCWGQSRQHDMSGPCLHGARTPGAEDMQKLGSSYRVPLEQQHGEHLVNEELVMSSPNWTNRVFTMKRSYNKTAVILILHVGKPFSVQFYLPSTAPGVFPKHKDKQYVLSAFSLGQGSAWGQVQHELACPAWTLTLALRLASLKPWLTHLGCVSRVQDKVEAHACGIWGMRPV